MTRFEKWCKFHEDNPEVFDMFRKFADYPRRMGNKVGARLIGERIRWESAVTTNTDAPKFNDHIWPYYSRLLMAVDKRFDGFFTTKDSNFDTTTEAIVEFHRK